MLIHIIKELLRLLGNYQSTMFYKTKYNPNLEEEQVEDILVINLNVENHYHGTIDRLNINTDK